jgi:hypothetical protein
MTPGSKNPAKVTPKPKANAKTLKVGGGNKKPAGIVGKTK